MKIFVKIVLSLFMVLYLLLLTKLILFKTFSITEMNGHISFSHGRYWGPITSSLLKPLPITCS